MDDKGDYPHNFELVGGIGLGLTKRRAMRRMEQAHRSIDTYQLTTDIRAPYTIPDWLEGTATKSLCDAR